MSINTESSVSLIEAEIQDLKNNVETIVLAETNCTSIQDLIDNNIHDSEDSITAEASEMANSPELAKAIDTLNAAGLTSIAENLKNISLSSIKFKFIMETMYS